MKKTGKERVFKRVFNGNQSRPWKIENRIESKLSKK